MSEALTAVADALLGASSAGVDDSSLVDAAIAHRVGPLLLQTPAANALGTQARARLAEEARLSALHSALVDAELARVLDVLEASGLSPVVTKGAHLAHTIYPSSRLRPRLDSDLLLPRDEADGLGPALSSHGYRRSASPDGRLILGEVHFERTLPSGVVHYLDAHWRVAEPLVFDRAFDVQGIRRRAVPVKALAASARGPAIADALALACVHLVAHHWESVRLLWLYDVHLLAARFSEQDGAAFVRAADDGRYGHVAYCALKTTAAYLPSAALESLIACVQPIADESQLSSLLTAPGRRKVDDLVLDLRVAGWRNGARLLREHVLPPPAYMRQLFGDRPLPVAYTLRLWRGVRRWF